MSRTPALPATGRGDAGFSLIELLIVVAALSVLVSAAIMVPRRPGAGRISDAARFESVVLRQEERAILLARPVGLRIESGAMQLLDLRDGLWQPAGEPILWQHPVSGAGTRGEGLVVVFWPSGQITPFDVTFRGENGQGVRCSGPPPGLRDGATCRPA
jgi:prepilin-type N-terminal cleavage/methylation domain-containing protein